MKPNGREGKTPIASAGSCLRGIAGQSTLLFELVLVLRRGGAAREVVA
jgi:hypothetical protein